MICNECAPLFFGDPVKIVIAVSSLAVALLTFLLILKRDLSYGVRVFLIYLHVFSLVFPFVFYLFFSGCSTLFSGCSKIVPVIYMLLITGVISAIIGSVCAPIVFMWRSSRCRLNDRGISRFVCRESGVAGIRPPSLFIVDSASPFAFSFSNIRPVIFVSVGLLDLLGRKELEAVLLHEIMHIRNGASIFRFSAFFMRVFSPLSMFASLGRELDEEELGADRYACLRQGTSRFVESAKRKIDLFFYWRKI
ncbi:M48 family metalloprotease [Candidatus Woesearchaeota archaeon]|nr:M48 family metalloprotease [Candidatus Woesearchaeota archaeon]